MQADIAVFDPETIRAKKAELVRDLPAGEERNAVCILEGDDGDCKQASVEA